MMEHAGNASSQTVEQEGLPCSAPPKVRLRCGWGLALTVHLEHPPLSSRVHPVLRHSFYLQVFPGKRTHSAPSCPAPIAPPQGSPPPQVRAGLYDTCSPMRTRAGPAACTAHPKAQAHSNHHGNNYIMCGLSRVFSSFFIISFSVHFYYNYLLNV